MIPAAVTVATEPDPGAGPPDPLPSIADIAYPSGMRSMRSKILLTALATIALTAVVALAQDAAPQPPLSEGRPPWQGYILGFLMAVLVIFASLLPSKRGHQD